MRVEIFVLVSKGLQLMVEGIESIQDAFGTLNPFRLGPLKRLVAPIDIVSYENQVDLAGLRIPSHRAGQNQVVLAQQTL